MSRQMSIHLSHWDTPGSPQKEGKKMKLVPTTEKVTIQWFAVLHDGSKMRNNKGFIHNAWDVKCSCGWESRTGGAIKACIVREVEAHKYTEHNYTWQVSN